jgi:hypothetical protein
LGTACVTRGEVPFDLTAVALVELVVEVDVNESL